MIPLQAHIYLHKTLSVEKKVIGKEFPIKIGRYKGKICFPIFDPKKDYSSKGIEDTRDFSLTEPKMFYLTKDTEWGRVVKWPTLDCSISCLAIKFEFKSRRNLRKIGKRICVLFPEFMRRFKNYFEHKRGIVLEEITHDSFSQDHVDFIYPGKGNKLLYSDAPPIRITVTLARNFAPLNEISDAFNFASAKKELRLEHIMLSKARLYLKSNKLNYSLLELSTSLELSISFVIKSYFKKKNQVGLGEHLLNKKTLGSLARLAEKVGIDLLDKNSMNDLIEDRNKCMHLGVAPDRKKLITYVKFVAEWNRKYLPLE